MKAIESIQQEAHLNKWPYPKTFEALKAAGVTSYTVKLGRELQTDYAGTFGHWEQRMPKDKPLIPSKQFSSQAVKEAVINHTKGMTNYMEFLEDIVKAGVTHYHVDMQTREIRYLNSDETDYHKEMVPLETKFMHQTTERKPGIKLVGIDIRTSYQQELDKIKGNIFPCVQKYFHGSLCEKIPHRANPGTTFCAYTDYESDYKGAYTYFIGEEVTIFDSLSPEGFQKLTIPAQTYAKFTTLPAPMPEVIVNAWNQIWKMTPSQLKGNRCYQTDFELYDERAADHQYIVLDIYVGVN